MKKPGSRKKDKKSALRRARVRTLRKEEARAAGPAQPHHKASGQVNTGPDQEPPPEDSGQRLTDTLMPGGTQEGAEPDQPKATAMKTEPALSAPAQPAQTNRGPGDTNPTKRSKLPPAPPGPGEPRLVIITTSGRNTGALRRYLQCQQYFNSDGPSQVYCNVACYLEYKHGGQSPHHTKGKAGSNGPEGATLERTRHEGALCGAGT